MHVSQWFRRILVALLVLGVIFRFVNLNHKVFGHHEVVTTLQAVGYLPEDVDQSLFQNHLITAQELQSFQQIKPGSTPLDTVQAVAIASPQNPPLYFLALRSWMQALGDLLSQRFNSSLTTLRSLPALISLFALPAMYVLAGELFASPIISLLATTLVALSPFDVLLAQSSQPYSLLTVLVITSNWLLLRAIRLSMTRSTATAKWNWSLYSLSVVSGLYTQSFFALTIFSHIAYVLACLTRNAFPGRFKQKILIALSVSLVIAIALFSPWIVVATQTLWQASATIHETQPLFGFNDFLKQGVLSLTTPFFDLDFGFSNPWTFLLRVPFLVLLSLSVHQVYRRTPKVIGLWIILSIATPILFLMVLYEIWDGKRSTISCYLISSVPGMQLAIAYFLGTQLFVNQTASNHATQFSDTSLNRKRVWLWRSILSVLIIASFTSLIVSALSNSWWDKDSSYFNDRTAELVNVIPDAIIVSDIGNRYTNTGDLLSLSYRLKGSTRLLLVETPEFIATEKFHTLIQEKTAIVFRPSKLLQQVLEQTYGALSPMLPGERIWKISRSSVRN